MRGKKIFFLFFIITVFSLRSFPPAQILDAIREVPEPAELVEQRRSKISGEFQSRFSEMWDKMYPFQRAGIVQMIERRGRAFLCDEMGLGKTVQSIGVVRFLCKFPVLIVCPKSLRSNWANEAVQWDLVEHAGEVQKISGGKDRLDRDAKVVIVTVCAYSSICVSF